MNASEINEKFSLITQPEFDNEYNMYMLHGDVLYLGRSYFGYSSILIKYPSAEMLPGGRKTKGLELHYYRNDEFTVNGQNTGFSWAVIKCIEESNRYIFSVLAEGILGALKKSQMSDPKDLLNYVSEWQELLASAGSMNIQQLIGLWGELFFILNAVNVQKVVQCWYGPEAKKFDFSGKGIDIEVKTALRGHYHIFSHEQLIDSTSGSDRYIFSIYAEEDLSGGLTVADLVNSIRKHLTKNEEFEKKLLSIGYTGQSESEIKLHPRSIKLVDIKDVPKVRNADIGVHKIKYEVDLGFCNKVDNPKKVIERLEQK